MNVLVTGATGYIGGRLVPRLLAAGHHVICLARDPSRLTGRGWTTAEIRGGDALDAASLRFALRGVDAAYYLIHSMAEPARGFEERDRVAAANFGAAAREAGVRHIIYLGGLGAATPDLSPHLASRHQVGHILRESGVPVTELQAAVIVGAGSVSFEMIRYLVERLPVMITPRWVATRCQPIAIDNVLDYLTQSLTARGPAAEGHTFEIGGPDVLTYGDMMRGYAAIRGLRRYLISVPFLTPRLSSYWVDLVTPIEASYSHPLIEGMRNEVIVRDHAARSTFDVTRITYVDAVRRALVRTEPDQTELTNTAGLLIEQRRVASRASAGALFDVFSRLGGDRGWLYADWIWGLRGFVDRLLGGVGMRRGRPRSHDLRPGDTLDCWRVEAVQRGQLIRLRAEMKTPGSAWLQFNAQPRPEGGALLIQTAYFDPHGLAGLCYWYALYPVHHLIFSGMARAIVRQSDVNDVPRLA